MRRILPVRSAPGRPGYGPHRPGRSRRRAARHPMITYSSETCGCASHMVRSRDHRCSAAFMIIKSGA
eukprot:424226-Hanusia_phi.AAC.2